MPVRGSKGKWSWHQLQPSCVPGVPLGTSLALATLQRGCALLHPQHPRLPGAWRCSLWPGHCGRVTHATISFLPCHRVLPGTGRDPSGWQHESILGTSSPVTPSRRGATRGRDILSDATPLQMSPNPPYGAAGCLLPPPAPPPPWGPPPADLKGLRPSTRDPNTTLPALCKGVTPQPSEQRPAQTGSSLPPSNASSRHRRPEDTMGSSVPSPRLDLPSCAALCRSGQKTSLNHWWGGNECLGLLPSQSDG